MAKYRCLHCGKTVDRKSKEAWIESYCVSTERMVHLQRVVIYKPKAKLNYTIKDKP